MEDHKVSRGPRVSVRNRYTVFLCEEDFDRLGPNRDALIPKLERHLVKHVRSKRYEIPGDVCVDLVLDTDLRLGHFGILAEREAPGFLEADLPGRLAEDVSAEEQWQVAASGSGAAATRPHVPMAPAASAKAATPRPVDAGQGGATRVILPADAAELGLARTTIVIRSGNRLREYNQGRIIIGRARETDFCIDNPDVSRRHAALYWSNGKIMIEDLGSTNGTMVNGYPVASAEVTPQDVIVIGDCRMSVDTR
jgi:hypothetical protein